LLGGFAAWLAFTLPSALILFGFAISSAWLTVPAAGGALHGLKLVAVAVIAQALVGMIRTLTPDVTRAAIAVAAIVLTLTIGGSTAQIGAIVLGVLAGLLLCADPRNIVGEPTRFPVSKRSGVCALILFVLLMVGPPLLLHSASSNQALALFNAFYHAGALVFGGGHVVLPLLDAYVVAPGWIDNETFLSGYGLAQAIPGPMFAVAAYLGALVESVPNGVAGALIALVAIFLPGLLLVYGMLPFWNELRMHPSAQAAMRGANAAVVGILGAALYSPAWTGAVFSLLDAALVLAGFLLLTIGKAPSWLVVVLLAGGGALASTI
jgi:chromate transporter